MARNFKNRPKDMKVSVYLIHTRLVAQGTVIGKCKAILSVQYKYLLNSVFVVAGVLCLGMLNEMYKNAAKKYDW